jgi:hypothetical protein
MISTLTGMILERKNIIFHGMTSYTVQQAYCPQKKHMLIYQHIGFRSIQPGRLAYSLWLVQCPFLNNNALPQAQSIQE